MSLGFDFFINDDFFKSPAKQARLEFLSRVNAQTANASSLTVDMEILTYLQKAQIFPLDGEISTFWLMHKLVLPTLFNLAKVMYSICPTSAKAERNFSISGALLTAKRASLAPERARKILFIHDNYNLFK